MDISTTLLVVIAVGVGALLRPYLGQKGKNLATKEDVGAITDIVESIRGGVRRLSFEHETRFSRLHERRIEAIDGLYKRLVRALYAFQPLLTELNPDVGEGESEAIKQKAGEAAQELLIFFAENRLYLDAALISEVERLHSVLREAWVTFVLDLRGDGLPMPQPERERRLMAWRRARDIIRDEAPALRERIEVIMRDLLAAAPPGQG